MFVKVLLGLGMDGNLRNSRSGFIPLMLAPNVKSPQAVVELLLTRVQIHIARMAWDKMPFTGLP